MTELMKKLCISPSNFPKRVKIYEVSPRDGLQNISKILTVEERVHFIELIQNAGFKKIETGSYVSEKWVPAMKGTDKVMNLLSRKDDVSYIGLVPNTRGLEKNTCNEIAVFTTVSETFSKKNTNCTIEESLKNISKIIRNTTVPVRGYVSCAVWCPYEGFQNPDSVLYLSRELLKLGCYQVSLGDTIGKANPEEVNNLLDCVKRTIHPNDLAVHFHDTEENAISNILVALNHQISCIDSSISGIGGCPYAGKGKNGNVSTEKVLDLLDEFNIHHGIDRVKLDIAKDYIQKILSEK